MIRRSALFALLAVLWTGCAIVGPPDDGPRDAFVVTVGAAGIVLDNGTDETVYFVALEAEHATRVDLNPNVETWPRLGPGERLSIPYDRLDGYDAGDREAVVYWSTGADFMQERVRL